jgi:hypothetical protein
VKICWQCKVDSILTNTVSIAEEKEAASVNYIYGVNKQASQLVELNSFKRFT